MTYEEIMAAKYANTAFAFLFEPRRKPQPPTDKELAAKARKKANNDRQNAKRQHRDSFALWKVIARSTGFNEAEQTACALPVRLAWSALKGGTANGDDIATLTDVIAICTVAGQNMDALVEETCEAARRAMCAVADRYTRCQRWGVDAAALQDIPPIVDFYEELLRVSTGGQMEQWLSAVRGTKARILYQVAA